MKPRSAVIAWLGMFSLIGAVGLLLAPRLAARTPQDRADAAGARAPGGYTPDEADPANEEWAIQAREEVQIAEARVKAKQAEITLASSRLKSEKNVLDYYSSMVERGLMPPHMEVQAQRTITEAEARLAMKNADLVELSVRLARARRAEQNGRATFSVSDPGIAARLDDIERRQFDLSRRVDRLDDYLRVQIRRPDPTNKNLKPK